MHIAYLLTPSGIPLGGNSGSSHHVAGMVDAFLRLGHEVTLFPAHKMEGPDPWPNADIIELAPQAAPWWRRSRSQRERWQAKRFAARALPYLQENKPDLLYERYALFSDAGARLRRPLKCPWVLEVNAPLRLERTRFEGLRGQRAARKAESRILHSADLLIAVSQPLARWLIETLNVPAERVKVVHNGVDRRLFNAHDGSAVLRQQLGLKSGPVLGFLGSLKPWHGVDDWLTVFRLARQQIPDLQGLVVGEGPGRAPLLKRLEAEGLAEAVKLLGRAPQAEIPPILRWMTLMLAPYPPMEFFYFCPLKVLESQAVGVPVISTAQGELPGLVGQGGRVVPAGNLSALVDAVVEGLQTPLLREQWSRAALLQSEGRDWMDVGARILAHAQGL